MHAVRRHSKKKWVNIAYSCKIQGLCLILVLLFAVHRNRIRAISTPYVHSMALYSLRTCPVTLFLHFILLFLLLGSKVKS